jgi:hypothetical protein
MTTLTGGCRCGKIRYTCEAAPITVSFCYCTDCQKASGGPFCNYAVVPFDAVTINQGETAHYAVEASTSNTVKREFCAHCGAPLFASTNNVFVITVGSLDDPGSIVHNRGPRSQTMWNDFPRTRPLPWALKLFFGSQSGTGALEPALSPIRNCLINRMRPHYRSRPHLTTTTNIGDPRGP